MIIRLFLGLLKGGLIATLVMGLLGYLLHLAVLPMPIAYGVAALAGVLANLTSGCGVIGTSRLTAYRIDA